MNKRRCTPVIYYCKWQEEAPRAEKNADPATKTNSKN